MREPVTFVFTMDFFRINRYLASTHLYLRVYIR